MDALREFLEFIESSKPESVEKLMHRVLLKCRKLTGAEAGTIFIIRGRGRSRKLEAADSQNDLVAVKPGSFVVPLTPSSIAGYTATTGKTVFVEDLYDLPVTSPTPSTVDSTNGMATAAVPCSPSRCSTMTATSSAWSSSSTADREPKALHPWRSVKSRPGLIVPVNHIVGSAIERADDARPHQGAERPACVIATRPCRAAGEDRRPARGDRRGVSSSPSTSSPVLPRSTTPTPPPTCSGSMSTPTSSPRRSGCPPISVTRSDTRPNSTMSEK